MFETITYKKGMIPESGKCYSDMPNDDYHEFFEWWSSSDLKNALRSIDYFGVRFHEKKNREEKEYKIAFEVGQAFHDAFESLILYDDLSLFEENAISFPGVQMSKKFLEIKTANPKKSVVPIAMFENIPAMAIKAKKEADTLNVFCDGKVELAFFWIDPETGIKLKCKTDYIRIEDGFIVDFKKTKDNSPKEFSRDIAKYNYHFSAAQYMEGVFQVTGQKMEEFILIAVNDTKPFEVEFYWIDKISLKEGNYLFRKVLNDLNRKEKPAPEFEKIGIPFWALTHIDKDYDDK